MRVAKYILDQFMNTSVRARKGADSHTHTAVRSNFPPVLETGLLIELPAFNTSVHLLFLIFGNGSGGTGFCAL